MAHLKKNEKRQRSNRFEVQVQRRTQKRDKKGQFAKKPPLDPAMVAELGADRKAVTWSPDQHWHLRFELKEQDGARDQG
jgi:hypothetical protein